MTSNSIHLIADDYAKRMIRAKFNGEVPAYVTPKECLELMLEFAKFQSERADSLEKLAQFAINRMPSRPYMAECPTTSTTDVG